MPGYVKPEYAFFLVLFVFGAAGGWLAANRGRSVVLWSILCALFPIFLLVIYFEKPRVEVEGKFRQCPSCKEFIKWSATICKYCNAQLPPRG